MKRSLAIAEWVASLLLTAVVIGLLVVRATHAGGLWRDECACVQLAQSPTWLEVQQKFQFEAFPLLFPAIMRGLISIFGTSDAVFRGYGLGVGLMLVGALWLNALWLQRRPPMIALALLGLNPTMLTWATTVRGYGIASVMIALTFGCMGQMRRKPNLVWIAVTFICAFLSVQLALHNCFLLLAVSVSAILVSLIRKEFKAALVISGIGIICAAFIIPYWAGYQSADWTALVKAPITIMDLFRKLLAACGGEVFPSRPLFAMQWVWGILGGLALLLGIARLCFSIRKPFGLDQPKDAAELITYGLGVLLFAPACYLGFLKVLSYPTQPWYYLLLMTMVACAIDLVLGMISSAWWWRLLRILFVVAALAWLPRIDYERLRARATNIDQVAAYLETEAVAGDLIVVMPWYLGVSFQWYYHGPLEWMTVPAISDLTVHRYDLIREKMLSESPLQDLADQIEATLSSGHRVWTVGNPPILTRSGNPRVLPLPPDPEFGWSEEAYRSSWEEQLAAYLNRHARRIDGVNVQSQGAVNGLEAATVCIISGWRN